MKQPYTVALEHKGRYLIMLPNGKTKIIESKEELENNCEKIKRK